MNREDLVKELSKVTKLSQKTVNDLLTTFFDSVEQAVSRGEKVTLVGFGTFERKERAARQGRNPQTGAIIQIEAKKVPTFVAGKHFKELVK